MTTVSMTVTVRLMAAKWDLDLRCSLPHMQAQSVRYQIAHLLLTGKLPVIVADICAAVNSTEQ